MQTIQFERSEGSRLRFVFDDAVVSFNLAGNADFGEIARIMDELTKEDRGRPLGIDVTMSGASRNDVRLSARANRPVREHSTGAANLYQ